MAAHEALIHLGVRKHSYVTIAFSDCVSTFLNQPRTELTLLWQLSVWHVPNYDFPVVF